MEHSLHSCEHVNLKASNGITFTKDLLFFTVLPYLLKGKLHGGVPTYIIYVHDENLQGNYFFLSSNLRV